MVGIPDVARARFPAGTNLTAGRLRDPPPVGRYPGWRMQPVRPSQSGAPVAACTSGTSCNVRPLTVAGAAQAGRAPRESAFLLPV